ncbi:MAG: 5'/3'-nucleotidase SurE, partial [Bacteroidales bacterium]|nr:5'/3'-nucleotidase SurE [Bacteroidales bacterium]
MERPLILVTNDDGFDAPGIRFLADTVAKHGDVIVVAPGEAMSGMGHAITIKTPLRFHQIHPNGNYEIYRTNGTPVDSVKLAMHKILPRKPDILVSGVNHGSNASVNIIYSGTMAAVFEGAMAGIPSVGFSITDYDHAADLKITKPFIHEIVNFVLNQGLPNGISLNVNFPATDKGDYKGMKICRQALAYWKEEFEERYDPHNQPYFWMRGSFVNHDEELDTDEWALKNGYVSVVPVQFDFTAFRFM